MTLLTLPWYDWWSRVDFQFFGLVMLEPLSQQELGQFLRRLREVRTGLTRSQVAERLGVHSSYLAHIENGSKVAQPGILIKLAHALGTEPMLLLARAGYWEMPGFRLRDLGLGQMQQLEQLWDDLKNPERDELVRVARYLALRSRMTGDQSAYDAMDSG